LPGKGSVKYIPTSVARKQISNDFHPPNKICWRLHFLRGPCHIGWK
jgi:hypothetical protein